MTQKVWVTCFEHADFARINGIGHIGFNRSERPTMSFDTSSTDVSSQAPEAGTWVGYLPDGSVSVAAEGDSLVLRASDKLQQQFESLLERRKSGTLTADERRQYDAICELDDALSWLNRLARRPGQQP